MTPADRSLRPLEAVKRDVDAAADELERAALKVSVAILLGERPLEPLRQEHRRAALDYARAAKRIFTTTEDA